LTDREGLSDDQVDALAKFLGLYARDMEVRGRSGGA